MSKQADQIDPRTIGARPDFTIDQDWAAYTEDEHRVWDELYERQMKVLPGRAADEFMAGLDALDLHRGGIPDFEKDFGRTGKADRLADRGRALPCAG